MPGTTDTVKAKLTPGEFVIRKEAVDMIGVPMLNKLNDMPEEGGHSAIDSLIQRATLSNMKMMYGGGMVQPNYAGGGMIENQMQGYQNGGKTMPSAMEPIDSRDVRSILSQFSEFPEVAVQGVYEMNEPSGRGKRYYLGEGQIPRTRIPDLEKLSEMALMNAVQSQEQSPQDSIPLSSVLQMLQDPDFKGDKQSITGMMKGGKVKKGLKPIPQGNPGLGKLPESVRNKMGYMQRGGEVEDSLVGMMYGGMANKKKKGYQDGGMIGPPVAPEMMGQAMNQRLDDSIDMRMANPQMGGALGMMRQESEDIEAAMKDNIARNARLALQKMKLDSVMQMEPQGMSIPDSLITNPQSLDNSFLRLLQEMNQSKGVRIPTPSTLR